MANCRCVNVSVGTYEHTVVMVDPFTGKQVGIDVVHRHRDRRTLAPGNPHHGVLLRPRNVSGERKRPAIRRRRDGQAWVRAEHRRGIRIPEDLETAMTDPLITPFHVAFDEGEGPQCALENCSNRTGSDAVYFCSHVHHDQWWSAQRRKSA